MADNISTFVEEILYYEILIRQKRVWYCSYQKQLQHYSNIHTTSLLPGFLQNEINNCELAVARRTICEWYVHRVSEY